MNKNRTLNGRELLTVLTTKKAKTVLES